MPASPTKSVRPASLPEPLVPLLRFLLKSKIHRAYVTESNLKYIGSMTIDQALMEKADLWPGEKILVSSNTSGPRLETSVLPGQKGSGIIRMNGAASKLIKRGEEIIIMAFTLSSKPLTPKVILVDRKNRFKGYL
jgi:aspartate 1-decarboxylase